MAVYSIRIRGHLADHYTAWFAPLTITREPSGQTVLWGELVDQGALFGILLKIRDLGLPLLSIAPDHDLTRDSAILTQEQRGQCAPRRRYVQQDWRNGSMTHQHKGGGQRGFFDAHQRETIAAAMARIIPTDDQPGAREAGTIDFLDRYLSSIDFVYAKPDGSGFEKLEGKRGEAWQQRLDLVRQKYVEGIADLDRRSQRQFAAPFASLTDAQQDAILTEIERPAQWTEHNLELAHVTAGYGAPIEPALQQTSAEVEIEFFPLLALHTRQGFYADPIYGGNKDRIGWKLLGFEGPESLAETHAGRYTTRPFFAEEQIDWGKEGSHDR